MCGAPLVALRANPTDAYLAPVRTFADNVLKHGRDVYGPRHTPLFVDGINIDTQEPVKWKSTNGTEWVLSDLGNQQILFRIFDGLTRLTGEPRYRQSAMDATRYAFTNLRYGGLLGWGGHMAYNASSDEVVCAEDKGKVHELKENYPHYDLMWEVDPDATRTLIESIWSGHILDWSNLDFNRHATPKPAGKLWQNEYKGGDPFFWGRGLTFLDAGSDLYYSAALLSKFTGEHDPLKWAKRLAHRYVETRDPKTGLSGYQFSQMKEAWCDAKGDIRGDRAQYQFAEYFPAHHVVEGTLFACYGQPGAYPQTCQMYLGETLGSAGREFTQWAIEELTAWSKYGYRAEDNSFTPMLTDGTSMEGFVVRKDGYFGPKGRVLKAGKAGASHFWAYTMAYRISGNSVMWEMARKIALANDLGEIGSSPNLRTGSSDVAALFGFLELHRKTGKAAYLEMARRVGDNLLAEHFQKGFFVKGSNHYYAKFDSADALGLLHLAAALAGKPQTVPPYVGSGAFFAAAYGDLGHQYDNTVIYSRTR
jgi:pectate lyase